MNRRNFITLLGGACALPLVKALPVQKWEPMPTNLPIRLDERMMVLEPVDLETNRFNQAWVDAPYEVIWLVHRDDGWVRYEMNERTGYFDPFKREEASGWNPRFNQTPEGP